MSQVATVTEVTEVAANFDITPTSIHIQRFTGHVYDWSILNDWPIQKIDLLTSTWGSLCNIAKYPCSPNFYKGKTYGKSLVLRLYLPNI